MSFKSFICVKVPGSTTAIPASGFKLTGDTIYIVDNYTTGTEQPCTDDSSFIGGDNSAVNMPSADFYVLWGSLLSLVVISTFWKIFRHSVLKN